MRRSGVPSDFLRGRNAVVTKPGLVLRLFAIMPQYIVLRQELYLYTVQYLTGPEYFKTNPMPDSAVKLKYRSPRAAATGRRATTAGNGRGRGLRAVEDSPRGAARGGRYT